MSVQCPESCSLARIKSLTHQIEFDYLKSKQISVDQYVASPPISIGNYDWALDFHPHGTEPDSEDLDQENDGSYVSLYLTLLSETKGVEAEYSFKILDQTEKFVSFDEPILHTFTSCGHDCSQWGYPNFISKDELENRYCKDGKFVISCNIRVLSAPCGVDDSCGGLFEDIEELWERGARFDMTFEVEGERISAHRFMLAVRSPVFEAELYGSMAEANSSFIKINDMKAEVFKALLQFIYTDDFNYEHRGPVREGGFRNIRLRNKSYQRSKCSASGKDLELNIKLPKVCNHIKRPYYPLLDLQSQFDETRKYAANLDMANSKFIILALIISF